MTSAHIRTLCISAHWYITHFASWTLHIILLIMATYPSLDVVLSSSSVEGEVNPVIPRPTLDDHLPANVTSQIHRTVRLNCRVHNLGDKRVVWLRKSDVHILTIGKNVFTDDKRFSVLHGDSSPDWTLQIKYPNVDDQGNYECQVSTNPKISYLVNLIIVVGEVHISGPDIADMGSPMTLDCNVTGPNPPRYVDWFLDGEPLERSSRVSMEMSHGERWSHSTLEVKAVGKEHGGHYMCKASEHEYAIREVRVVEGNQPAQLRSANGATSSCCCNINVHLSLVAIIVSLTHHVITVITDQSSLTQHHRTRRRL